MSCDTLDAFFPQLADIYYPMTEQSPYGNVVKNWMLDKVVAGHFAPAGVKAKQEITPNPAITQQTVIIGRTRCDVRISSAGANNAITNVIITNIKNKYGEEIYVETAGPRVGKSTIFEIATQEPVVGPFGKVDYYKLVLRRSDNQDVNV
jgi:hypothetical protein